MSLLDEIKKFISQEIIDSNNVDEIAKVVMLDITFKKDESQQQHPQNKF